MPLINSLLSTNLGSKALLSPAMHRLNMAARGLLGSAADFKPSMMNRLVAALKLSPEERRALTYVNTAGLRKNLSAPPEVLELAEQATKKLEGLGIGRPVIRQMAPGVGAAEPLLGARGRLTAEAVRKIDPVDYIYRVSEKFTPHELDTLATAKALAEGRTITPPAKVLSQFARRGIQYDTSISASGKSVRERPWMMTPVTAKSNPEFMAAADPLYKRLRDLGLSDETIKRRLSFGDVTAHQNPVTKGVGILTSLLGLAGGAAALARAVRPDAEPTTLKPAPPDVPPVHFSSITEMMSASPEKRSRALAPVLRAMSAPPELLALPEPAPPALSSPTPGSLLSKGW